MLVVSLPSSRYFITISLIIMVVNWLAEGGYRRRFKKFYSDTAAVSFTAIYLLYLVGLLWSADLEYAFNNDLLHKLPTLFMPIIFVTSPLPALKRIRLLPILFILSVFTVSIIGLVTRIDQPHLSYREASPFIPGIYFGMMLVLAAFQIPSLILQISKRKVFLIIGLALSAWLIFYLFYLRSLSGIASLAGVSLFMTIMFAKRLKGTFLKGSILVVSFVIAALVLWPMVDIYRQTHSEIETEYGLMEIYSESGYRYEYDTTNILRENGHLVYLYIAEGELGEAWNRVSDYDFNGNDLSGHQLKHTLFRFMASKGLKRDRDGLSMMSDADIKAVEKGVTNYLNINRPGFYIRVYEEMTGLYLYSKSSATGAAWSSSSQRIDLWRASMHAFRKHPVFGWGTGSILHAVDYGFIKNGSVLLGKNMKPHNQYLYLLLTMGVAGLILFLSLYTIYIVKSGVYKVPMFQVFIILFAINFLANNSIESQLGQNLFLFFSLYYGYYYPRIIKTPLPI
jgi:hypothetical protein